MIKPFTFRALSPNHATPMELDYLLRVIEAAVKYGFNAIQICGDTHGEGNLDGLTEFVRFPKANEVQDLEAVRRRRELLRQVCQAAHQHGLEVYYWHHELWYPERLAEVYPDWFVPVPETRFTRDLRVHGGLVPRVEGDAPIWDFMDAKFDEAFEQCPELDGTVMTIQEARVPIYCLFDDMSRQVAALLDQYKRLEAAHDRVGKKWIVRTFAWREHEYRVVTEAIRQWRPSVPVESKGVPMDWSLYFPYDPLLGKFRGMTKHVELAPSCEFHGCTRHPVAHSWYYTENLAFAGKRGHTGTALRIDREGVSMRGGPDVAVLAGGGKWLNDPEGTDPGGALRDWMRGRYGLDDEGLGQMQYDVLGRCWRATLRTYHNDKIYIGDSFRLGYSHHFFVAERDRCVEYDEPSPLAEKDEGIEYADRAAAAVEALEAKLTAADYEDLRERVRLLQLTSRTFRALVAALVARQRQMYEPSQANAAALAAAVDDIEAAGEKVRQEYAQTLDAPGQQWRSNYQLGPQAVAFAREMREDLPNLPRREIVVRLTAAALGANSTHNGQQAFQPPVEATWLKLQGRSGARHVLVIFAGTEMCVRRPLVVRCAARSPARRVLPKGLEAWEHRFDVGQYAWMLAHDRFRRYEVEVPRDCFDEKGACEIELLVPEPSRSPYLREVRLEVETAP